MPFHPNSLIQDPQTAFYLGINEKLERLPKGSIPLYEGKGTNYTPELTGTGFGIHVGTFKKLIYCRACNGSLGPQAILRS